MHLRVGFYNAICAVQWALRASARRPRREGNALTLL